MAAGEPRYRVTILVLGDLGRSPRMLNHAWAFAQDGAAVALAGYHESKVDCEVAGHPQIRLYQVRSLTRARQDRSRLVFLIISGLRAAFLAAESFWLLWAQTPRADVVLIQNPPSSPTLLVGWLAARLRGSRFVVDWHNFGYAMLAPRLGPAHLVVRLARFFERWLGSKADAHLCVSLAMRDVLVTEFGLPAVVVLPDRPREFLPLLPMGSRSAAAHHILGRADLALPPGAALAVCPTSWSADEDMHLLLAGLRLWDSQGISPELPPLFVLITGRGPRRDSFEQQVAGLPWKHVTLRTAFLDPADYRELLRSAHFGFCLHRSTSGVDLPMKLMDLFGARTPACVLDYGECLNEQISPGNTALTFQNSQELAACIDELLRGFPQDLQLLERMQQNIEASCRETWEQVWQREAAPVFHRAPVSA